MEEYHYSVGRIRALEARMLNSAQVARLAAAADFESAFSVLSETIYADNLPGLKHPFDFGELCDLELVSLKDLMDRLAPENEILAALFRKYDYLNIKILLRNQLEGAGEIKTYSRAGTILLDNLRLYIAEDINEIDSKEITEAIDAAKNHYEQTRDPQSLDLLLDRRYFAGLKEVLRASPSPLIQNLADHLLDLTNIKTLLRVQKLQRNGKLLEASLVEPGIIGRDILLALHDRSPAEIVSRLNYTPYFPALAEGMDEFSRSGSFHLLEKSMDDFVIDRFRKAKYISSGTEPLVGFFLAKEAEIRTLRFILVNKMNEVSSDLIKERIRASYV